MDLPIYYIIFPHAETNADTPVLLVKVVSELLDNPFYGCVFE